MPRSPAPRLLFEALPPPLGTRDPTAHVEPLHGLRDAGVDGVLVPEVLDGDYPTMDPVRFAAMIQESLGLPAHVACVAPRHPPARLAAWARDAAAHHGVRNLFMVGPPAAAADLPGPGVPEALRLLRGSTDHLGVVAIPTRRRSDLDEPERLLGKQEAGADYAVSQILTEPDAALRLQSDTDRLAQQRGRPPIPVLWGLAPVTRRSDVRFLQRLGVHVPGAVERKLSEATGPTARLRCSHRLNEETAARLLAGARGPTGFCISHVRRSNVPHAVELAARVHGLIRGEPATLRAAGIR